MSIETQIKETGSQATLKANPYFYAQAFYSGKFHSETFIVFGTHRASTYTAAARHAIRVGPDDAEVEKIHLYKNNYKDMSALLLEQGKYIVA